MARMKRLHFLERASVTAVSRSQSTLGRSCRVAQKRQNRRSFKECPRRTDVGPRPMLADSSFATDSKGHKKKAGGLVRLYCQKSRRNRWQLHSIRSKRLSRASLTASRVLRLPASGKAEPSFGAGGRGCEGANAHNDRLSSHRRPGRR